MSEILWKSFNLFFSKFKCFPTVALPPPPIAAALDDLKPSAAAAEANPALFKTFNSLYDACNYSDSSTSKSLTFSSSTATNVVPATEEDSDFSDDEWVPDFSSAFASHRFFFSSPGSSNSIFEPPPPRDPGGSVVSGGVAVQTYSPDPYSDFRQSMVEMIEARGLADVKAEWEFLNELLLCYLTLNPKHTHKFIVEAFADIVVSLVASPPGHGCPKTHLR